MDIIIETNNLTKIYPSQPAWQNFLRNSTEGYLAVDCVNLRIKKGELFGLVGPNGAGKTTLVKLLSTLIIPTYGTICVNGYDIKHEIEIKKSIGLSTSDERSFYWRLTGRQNLQFFSSLYNLPKRLAIERIESTLEQVELTKMADKRFHSYSTGMRQRLAIARAMLTKPKIIFLDEPSKGLDPHAAENLHNLIKTYLIGTLGITVFLTSHHLKEVEDICDRIAVMNNGRIQACGTMVELRKLLGPTEHYHLEAKGIDAIALKSFLDLKDDLMYTASENGSVIVDFKESMQNDLLTKVIKMIVDSGGRITSVSCDPISLSTIFNHITSQKEQELSVKSIEADYLPSSNTSEPHAIDSCASFAKASAHQNASNLHKIQNWLISKARILLALTKRDMLSETSYRFSFFMQIVEIFLTVAALYFLSTMFGQEMVKKHLMQYGGDYFSFSLIGVAFYSYFNIGFSSFAAKLQQAQSTGTLEAMLSTPADLSTIVLGSSIWQFIMTSIRVIVFLICGAFMFPSELKSGSFSLSVLLILLAMVSASSFGIISASFIIVVKRGDPISWLFKSASWILGGVVFPVTVLPFWMQKISLLLPTVHALKAIRLVLLKGAAFNDVLPQIAALSVYCFLLLPISLSTLNYAINRSKREGTLTHY